VEDDPNAFVARTLQTQPLGFRADTAVDLGEWKVRVVQFDEHLEQAWRDSRGKRGHESMLAAKHAQARDQSQVTLCYLHLD